MVGDVRGMVGIPPRSVVYRQKVRKVGIGVQAFRTRAGIRYTARNCRRTASRKLYP